MIGTRGTFGLPGTKKIRFYMTVTKAALLKTPFHTEGGFRVGDTRLRVYLTTKSGDVLAVRDGHIKVSIARIKSGRAARADWHSLTVRDVPVRGGEIALGQLLQFAGIVDTGGQAKQLLLSDEVLVNDEPEGRRGRKLHEGDVVEVTGQEQMRIVTADDSERVSVGGDASDPSHARGARAADELPAAGGAVRPPLAALPARRRDPGRAARVPLAARAAAALRARADARADAMGGTTGWHYAITRHARYAPHLANYAGGAAGPHVPLGGGLPHRRAVLHRRLGHLLLPDARRAARSSIRRSRS